MLGFRIDKSAQIAPQFDSGNKKAKALTDEASQLDTLTHKYSANAEFDRVLRRFVRFGGCSPKQAEEYGKRFSSTAELEKSFEDLPMSVYRDPNNPVAVLAKAKNWVELPNGVVCPPEATKTYSVLTRSDVEMVLAATGMDASKGQIHSILGLIAIERETGNITGETLGHDDIALLRYACSNSLSGKDPGFSQMRVNELNKLFETLDSIIDKKHKRVVKTGTTQRQEFDYKIRSESEASKRVTG